MSSDISLSRRRKLLVLASLRRMSVSLCCTSGWSMRWTLLMVMDFRGSSETRSEHRAVADDVQGGQAAAKALRQQAPGRPGAAFEHAGQRQLLRREPERGAHLRREFVEQRDRERAPFDDEFVARFPLARGVVGGQGAQHAGVDQQAAVAVLGQAGERVQSRHRHAGPLEGLEQRIGEPLRELVERHPAGGQACAPHRRMRPAVAHGDAADGVLRGPDAGQGVEHGREDVVCLDRGPAQGVEQSAGAPERAVGAGVLAHRQAEAAQHGGAALQAHQRVAPAHLEGRAQGLGRQGREASRVHPQRLRRVAGEQAGGEGVDPCTLR
eukprot:Opistho-1_new@46227